MRAQTARSPLLLKQLHRALAECVIGRPKSQGKGRTPALCVCVCVCKRERERKRGNVFMVSREHKRAAALHEKLQLLRSITNSHAVNETSIIVDASNYIEELKEKVERLNQDLSGMQSPASQVSFPTVTVETLEKGFLINVFSDKSCPGLLVSILEAFEELNLNVVEARASCTENFRLQAISGEGEEQNGGSIDAHVVRQAVLQAIRDWSKSSDDQRPQQ